MNRIKVLLGVPFICFVAVAGAAGLQGTVLMADGTPASGAIVSAAGCRCGSETARHNDGIAI
jgi:hypothetical protein